MNNKNIFLRELKKIEKEAINDEYLTSLKKQQFITELKNGLGDEMKRNLTNIKVIKKPWYHNIMNSIKNFFKTL
jgi:hypothetical protein